MGIRDEESSTLLSGIDDIAWEELTHAYGSAGDVPDLLRQIASPRKKECKAAIDTLYGNIWHQGTIYQATAFAVPFLVELAMSPDVVCRPAILCYLQAVATGSTYLDGNSEMDPPELTESKVYQEWINKERDWVAATRQAVLSHFDDFVALFESEDADVRGNVPVVLSACTDRHADVIKLLKTRLKKESDPSAKANAAYVLGFCERKKPAAPSYLKARFSDKQEAQIVRVTSALGLLCHGNVRHGRILEFLAASLPDINKTLNELTVTHVLGRGDGLIPEVSTWTEHNPKLRAQWLSRVIAHDSAKVRESALWEVDCACMDSRSVTRTLIPVIAACLKDSAPKIRRRAAAVLETLGDDVPDAVENVISFRLKLADDIRRAVQERRSACEKNCKIERQEPRTITGRTDSLLRRAKKLSKSYEFADTSELKGILRTLGGRRKASESIEPVLNELLRHNNRSIRIRAAWAIWELTEDEELVLPTLLNELSCRADGCMALEFLARMKSAAVSAIPQLQEMIEQDRRLPTIGMADSWIAMDEYFVKYAKRAMKRIENDTDF